MTLDGPILDKVRVGQPSEAEAAAYPFTLDLIRNLREITFPTQVTFFVGENGTGKSTILEAIASRAGMGREGGSRNTHFATVDESTHSGTQALASCLTLSWRKKVRDGYFFRAESFFNFASHLDSIAREGGQGAGVAYASYGDKSLHEQSHGESFLALFKNRIGGGGFYIFDEPEAALSPQRQLALLSLIHELCKNPETQLIIATHSPILLAYPGATIYSCDSGRLETVGYRDTKHYEITKGFLDNPDRYLKRLFEE